MAKKDEERIDGSKLLEDLARLASGDDEDDPTQSLEDYYGVESDTPADEDPNEDFETKAARKVAELPEETVLNAFVPAYKSRDQKYLGVLFDRMNPKASRQFLSQRIREAGIPPEDLKEKEFNLDPRAFKPWDCLFKALDGYWFDIQIDAWQFRDGKRRIKQGANGIGFVRANGEDIELMVFAPVFREHYSGSEDRDAAAGFICERAQQLVTEKYQRAPIKIKVISSNAQYMTDSFKERTSEPVYEVAACRKA